uniref:Patched domain-containing protein 3 n=1 Tax=Esox lucius TaxID=8010 RepID=A0A3P9A7K8_ESOLU
LNGLPPGSTIAMAKCHTDCIELPLRMCFREIGRFIGTHPWWFFIVPIVASIALGSGFYFLKERTLNDIEKGFTPLDGPAKKERTLVEEHFRPNESMFSTLRLTSDGTFACFVATSDSNILTVAALQEILVLDSKVRNLTVKFQGEQLKYVNICATVSGGCSSDAILDIIGYNASNIDVINLTFPIHPSKAGRVSLTATLGGVIINNNSVVQYAKAIRVFYYLQELNQTSEELNPTSEELNQISEELKQKSDTWLKEFVSYSTSKSRQWEFDRVPSAIVPLFSATFTITMLFAIVSCSRLDNVRNKLWVATIGVFSTGLAVLFSFGMLLLFNVTFFMTVSTTPFLVLGIGINDMFIMISCWQKTKVCDDVADRLADTYEKAIISMSITTLTDILALYLGYSSPFLSIQNFCIYSGTTILLSFVYNIVFLGAFFALNGRREANNRHWFTCAKIPEQRPPTQSQWYGVFCVGGAYNHDTGTEEELPMSTFFLKIYGPFLTLKWTKAFVVVLYAVYFGLSVYGCFILTEDFDLRYLATDESYITKYYDDEKHFSQYGPYVMVVINETLAYWEEEQRKKLILCIDEFQNQSYVDQNISLFWLNYFQIFANESGLHTNSEKTFKSTLHSFLEQQPMNRQDINLTEDNEIRSSRLFLQTVNVNTSKLQTTMLKGLRTTASNCPIKLLVYHPTFVYFDQYNVIVANTIQTIAVVSVVMLVISLFLIPNPLCSLWVAFSVGSVIVGVAGFMAFWGVHLNSISMINLIICIGFSVDFSAHVSYAFVASTKDDVNEKAVDALAQMGYPIVQGALSTILGVVALAFSDSYIFRIFFQIIFLVIVFGLIHGVAFLPVFMTFLTT